MNPMINVDGAITLMADATIPVMDRGFLYGDSVYEVFRTYKGIPVFMADHCERLENSAALISMTISQSREELIEEIRRTVRATGAKSKEDIYVRYQVTRGVGPVDLYPDPDLETRYVIIVSTLPSRKPEYYSRGMDMAIPSVRRNPENALDPNIKGGNYLNNILAITEARQLGADDCIILNREGFVTEAANSNVWFVINGQLITPATGNLKGLTKMHIHRALREARISSQETDIQANELYDASECFVTSATRDVMPCASLRLEDGAVLQFPEGGGEITRQVQAVFLTYLDEYAAAHPEDALV
uniref:Aminodeoxychorismate lyase n=1 Tax=uncultured gamma proteobacterium HF0200_34B07 TaxID=723571 RepID=E7C418_9GAMM|nr:branched-chain amino acid aminotransferase/4-amino-4-deoxychorismate lyase [uncultured gamma proteobacterium HF0200_34B07]